MSNIREFKLPNLIKEAITMALYEQKLHEAAPGMAQQPPALPPQQNAGPVPPPPTPPPIEQVPPTEDPNAQQHQPLTVDSMIERLNVVRGGRSFTDPEIYGQLVTYFKKLSPEQLSTIDQYLQDLSKVVVNVEQNQQNQEVPPDQQNQQIQGGGSPQPPIGATSAASPPAGAAPSAGSMPGM